MSSRCNGRRPKLYLEKKVSHTGVQVLVLEVFAACSVVQESFVLGDRKSVV